MKVRYYIERGKEYDLVKMETAIKNVRIYTGHKDLLKNVIFNPIENNVSFEIPEEDLNSKNTLDTIAREMNLFCKISLN